MILYKYLHPDRVDVLENLKIRYTQVTALNDPFESFLGMINNDKEWYQRRFKTEISKEIKEFGITGESKKKQYYRKRKKDFPNWYTCYTDEVWLEKKAEEIQKLVASAQGTLSLSATCKNILMWSHYANNHEGFIIGFDDNHEYFGKSVWKVKYADKRPYYDPTITKHSPTLFSTKSIDWAYEQEYRKRMSLVEEIKLESGNNLAPFDDTVLTNSEKNKVFLFDIPKEAITCVIFGWKSEQSLKSRILSAIKSNQIDNVSIQRAVPHKYNFEMDIL